MLCVCIALGMKDFVWRDFWARGTLYLLPDASSSKQPWRGREGSRRMELVFLSTAWVCKSESCFCWMLVILIACLIILASFPLYLLFRKLYQDIMLKEMTDSVSDL